MLRFHPSSLSIIPSLLCLMIGGNTFFKYLCGGMGRSVPKHPRPILADPSDPKHLGSRRVPVSHCLATPAPKGHIDTEPVTVTGHDRPSQSRHVREGRSRRMPEFLLDYDVAEPTRNRNDP